MGQKVIHTDLATRNARKALARRGKPYYQAIEPGCHLGYRKGKDGGKWLARSRLPDGEYKVKIIGIADDTAGVEVDGERVLDWRQARAKAQGMCTALVRQSKGMGSGKPYTVSRAIEDYLTDYETRGGKSLSDINYRANAFILPRLGDKLVSDLTPKIIRDWHRKLASDLPRIRIKRKATKQRYRDTADDPEAGRKRRHSANKVLTILKAALNLSWHEGESSSDDAWRRVKPFKDVDAPRIRNLDDAEAKRLVNACQGAFRGLVTGALLTGARYGELGEVRVSDFSAARASIHIRVSKSGKPRDIALADEAVEFFRTKTAGRKATDRIFVRDDGKPWGPSHQRRPMLEACKVAKIVPAIGFHILRHTYASRLAMRGLPMGIIQSQLGHADVRMTTRHYAHLSPGHVSDTIRGAFGELGIVEPSNVVPLTSGEGATS